MSLKINEYIGYAREDGRSMVYQDSYFDKYVAMSSSRIGKDLNEFRVGLVAKYGCGMVLDIGVGDLAFVRGHQGTGLGYDVCEKAIKALKQEGRWFDPYEHTWIKAISGVTFFDSLEHIEKPRELLDRIAVGTMGFFTLPIFDDIHRVTESKHYRPVGEGGGVEHWHYWTREGFLRFLFHAGFCTLEVLDDETRLGREGILTFVAKKLN